MPVNLFEEVSTFVHASAKSRQSTYLHLKEAPKEVRIASRKGEIPLGYFDPEHSTELFTIKFTGQRMNVLTSGALAGVGKTCNLGTYFLDFLDNIPIHRLIIDPQHEFWYRRDMNRHDLERIIKCSLQPKAHGNLLRVTPTCMNYDGDTDLEYLLDTRDMTREDLLTMLNLDERRQSDINLINRLDYALYGSEFGKEHMTVRKRELPTVSIILDRIQQLHKETFLQNNFKNLIMRNALGVGQIIDIIELMKTSTVILQTSTGEENYNILASYVGKILRDINIEKQAMISNKHTRLPNPVFIYFGEYNVYYPRTKFSSSKRQINHIYDYGRKRGISIWADCPDFYGIDPKAIRQSDYILAYKLVGANLNILRDELKLGIYQVEALERLMLDKTKKPPAQMAVLKAGMSPDDKIPIIYPIPPLSNIHRE